MKETEIDALAEQLEDALLETARRILRRIPTAKRLAITAAITDAAESKLREVFEK